jgi:hypothetical protein
MDLGTVVVGVLSSGAGGWFGATFAVQKLRAEKAFERQLEWHEEMVDILDRLNLAIIIWTHHYLRRSSDSEQHNAMADYDRQVERFERVVRKAKLYATHGSRERVLGLMKRMSETMEEITTAHAASIDAGDEDPYVASMEALRLLLNPVSEAAGGIAADARHLLQIDAEDRWPILRFFRKRDPAKAGEA